MFNLILAFLLGITTGTFAGLTPGIHANLIATFVLSLASILQFQPITLIIFITAMAITQTFVDFVPAIFFGAPDEDTALGALPGHELLLSGRGHHAFKLTLLGSTTATISLVIIIPVFILIIPKIFLFLQRMMAFILIWTIIFLIYSERESKIKATIIFTLSGFIGLATLNLNINQSLLPLLTGLFGTSTMIYSIKSKTTIPKQKIEKLNLDKKQLIKPTLATIIISPICSFLPGLGSSQAAIIGSRITGELDREQFLVLLGSVNTIIMSISFVTLFLIQKSRTGAAFAISQITQLSTNYLIIIFIIIVLSTIVVIPISLILSKLIAKNIHKIPYTKISTAILIFLIIIITIISGFLGLIILIISTTIGLTCIEFKTRRSFLMGAILIPTIIFYLPF